MIAAAVYGARYVSDRFLPDKAIDLVDEAASALRLAQESKPEPLDALEREITTLQIELASLANESDPISVERRARVEETLKEKGEAAREMGERWKEERERLGRAKERKRKLEEARRELEVAQREGWYERAGRLRFAVIPELEREMSSEGAPEQGGAGGEGEGAGALMLHDRVTSDDIARVVAKATGIPVQNLMKGERERLVRVSALLFAYDDAFTDQSVRFRFSDGGYAPSARCWPGPCRESYW